MQLTPEFPPPLVGGGGYHVYNLVRELIRKGIDVEVFTLNIRNTVLFKKTRIETHFGKVKVFRIPASYIPKTIYPIAPKLIPLLMKRNPDIIHAHGYQFFTSDAASIVSRKKEIPLVLTLHGFPRGFNKLTHKAYFNLIGKKTLGTAQKIISVSSIVAQEFKEIGISKEKIAIVPNGININEFKNMPQEKQFKERLNIKQNEKIILTIGRLEKIKGFQYLIKALPSILKEVGPTKLIIAGPEFNYGTQLKKLAEEADVKDHVIFYGPINGKEKIEAFTAADIIAIPSLYEGFSILLLEAMAAGKPLVATKTGAALEIIQDGKNGFLTKPGDTNDLSEKIINLLNDHQLSSSMSQFSRNTAKIFDWTIIAKQILAIYDQCLKTVT
jgi:glycosyltransferase involved in cell wall biosynthesis